MPTYALTNQYTKHYSEQISDPVYLTKGQKCYLKALAKEHDGSDFVKVEFILITRSVHCTEYVWCIGCCFSA